MGIDVGKFLKKPEYDIRITTYRDVFQVEALEYDRLGEDYKKLSAIIMISKEALKKMNLKPGDRVKLSNRHGSVVVEVTETKRDETGGVAFMVNSPWSNALVSGETRGIPEFKDIKATLSITNEEVTPVERLIEG